MHARFFGLAFALTTTTISCFLTTSFDEYRDDVDSGAASDSGAGGDGATDAPTSSDGGVSSEAGTTDASDAATCGDFAGRPLYPCTQRCAATTACCVPPPPVPMTSYQCSTSCNNGLRVECLHKDDCDAGICCFDRAANGGKGATVCVAGSMCPPGDDRFCGGDSECGAGSGCKKESLANGQLVGTCKPCP
jgi:hypothetical protein